MLHHLRLLVLLLCLACLLPAAALADGDKDGDGAKPAPPAPQDGAPAAPGDDAAPTDDEEEPEPDDPVPEPPPDTPQGARVTNDAVSPVAVPAGMVYLEGGRVWIGSDSKDIDKMLAGRPPDIVKYFLYERPYHPYFLRPYFIGKYEVSNAQYLKFLEAHPTEYDTAQGSLATLDEIAAALLGLSPEERKSPRQVAWRQLYFANKEPIWAAFGERLAKLVPKRPDGTVDEELGARNLRFEPLPRTLKLKFYSLPPPANWPDMGPPAGESNHPVRFVTYNDFEMLAEWAGMHIPTEYEWEWAARGPGGPLFPWGDTWVPNASLANWGGKITSARYETTTLPVDSRGGANPDGKAGKDVPIDGDGRSWCGLHHMLGNVAEWTSSWFEPYRDNRFTDSFMGRWVKVIRGGSAADGEMLVLRPACRNYIGGGPDAPPYPENAFPWCGVRLAHYMQSGRDQLGPTVRRVVRPKKVKEEDLDEDRFVGADTHSWVEPGATPDDHVYVLGRAHAILLVPMKSFLRPEGMEAMRNAYKKPSKFKDERSLARETEDEHPFWQVGVLHTDLTLEPVLVRRKLTPEEEEKEKKRSRGRARAPETEKGKAPPGTYVLGIWFGRLALLSPSMEFVGFLPLQKGQKSHFDVKKVKPDEVQDPVLKVDPELDWADFSFDMPLGGKGVDEDLRLEVAGRLQFEFGSLESAGTWESGNPAKQLVAELWARWLEAEAKAAKAGGAVPPSHENGKMEGTKPK